MLDRRIAQDTWLNCITTDMNETIRNADKSCPNAAYCGLFRMGGDIHDCAILAYKASMPLDAGMWVWRGGTGLGKMVMTGGFGAGWAFLAHLESFFSFFLPRLSHSIFWVC